MTTAMDRVRAARHWSFIMPGTAGALQGEAARLQGLGVAGAMVPQIFGPPWAALGVIAASSDLEIGSGIAMGFVRSPLETAMAALDLDKISGGRLTLGLGTSVREWNEDRFGVPYERPLARLRELVVLVHQMVTAAEQGDIGRFEGDFFSVDLRGHAPAPAGAAVGPDLAGAAARADDRAERRGGRRAARPSGVVAALDHAARCRTPCSAASGGRAAPGTSSRSSPSCASPSTRTSTRPPRTPRRACRCTPRSPNTRRTSPPTGSPTRRAPSSLAASGAPYRDLAAAITDEMAREFVIVGTPEEAAEQIADLLPYVDELCLTAPTALPPDRTREYEAAIAQHLLPLGG